jgi:formate C-acetyltransferase
MRAALALEKTLQNMSIKIDGDELLAGAKTIKRVAGPLGIERSLSSYMTLIGFQFNGKETKDIAFMDRVGYTGPEFLKGFLNVPEETIREFSDEILTYWKDKDLTSRMVDLWRKAGIYYEGENGKGPVSNIGMQGHVTVGLKKVLDMGFAGIARQAGDRLAKLKPKDPMEEKRRDFLSAVQVCARAVCDFSNRYADLARTLAEKSSGPRKQELLDMAARCRKVPENPPENFMEALQSIWMTQITTVISYGEDSIFAPGRVDQFLYPFYAKDLDQGRMTRDQALEAIEEYMIKISTFLSFGANNVTIGGVTPKGEDAVNEVSYLFLDAHYRLKGMRNGLAVRISEKNPRSFLLKTCETHRTTAGVAFYNDDVVIRDLMGDGYNLEEARNYSIVGCVEPTGTGNNNGYTAGNSIRLSSVLDMALHQGRQCGTGWMQIGPETASPETFTCLEDVKQAFAEQLRFCFDLMTKRASIKDKLFSDAFPTPLISSTIEGCVESGLDITSGGAKVNHGGVSARALATVTNSLAAIQWAVFEKKLLSMKELMEHLDNNFKDAESLRQQLIHQAPKYGNGDPEVDALAVWVADTYSREARKRPFDLGGIYRPLLVSSGTHMQEGKVCGATPDGRMAGQPVSNGISPANGTEKLGLTAAFRSAAAVCAVPMSNGSSINLNINPVNLKSEEGLEKFASLIQAYFDLGGRQVQINPMNKETLKDAQANPRNYMDLMVKVSGYSYRFVDLSRALQDDILARTDFAG